MELQKNRKRAERRKRNVYAKALEQKQYAPKIKESYKRVGKKDKINGYDEEGD